LIQKRKKIKLKPGGWLAMKEAKKTGVLPPANTKRTDQDPARRRHE